MANRFQLGFARVEECSDSVVREVAEPERDPFDPLDEVVEGFGGSVGYLRDVPVGDLEFQSGDGATRLVDLGWTGFVLQVVRELEGVSDSEDRFVDPVDVSDGFLRVPGGADFAVGVAGVEETTQPCLAPFADAFVGGGEEASYPIERVSLCGLGVRGFRSGLFAVLHRDAGWPSG